jgi:hypothetical protein
VFSLVDRVLAETNKGDDAMTGTFRRVPYAPDPNATPYHAAHAHADTHGSKHPAKFAWWYVDNYAGQLTVPDAWERAPDEVKAE